MKLLKNMRVSFDFDQTLGEYESIQEYARELILRNVEVWIVTSRYPCGKYPSNPRWNNKDLFEIAENLKIPFERIIFTEWIDKFSYFLDNPTFAWHLDDCSIQVLNINEYSNVMGIHYESEGWKEKCENRLLQVKELGLKLKDQIIEKNILNKWINGSYYKTEMR